MTFDTREAPVNLVIFPAQYINSQSKNNQPVVHTIQAIQVINAYDY